MCKYDEQIFYVYVYLDPRKFGRYVYSEYEFEYEPFYVGMGHGCRKDRHLKNAFNNHMNSKVKKIQSEVGHLPFVILYKENIFQKDAFELEMRMIKSIGRSDLKLGPLCNHTDGGDGMRNPSTETRYKISSSQLGRKPWNKGIKNCFSKETILKTSKSHQKYSNMVIENIRKMRKQGYSWKKISEHIGIPTRTIRDHCKDIKIIQVPKFSNGIKECARKMRREGKSWSMISKELNIGMSTIRKWCKCG